jgi:hypothetical protein
MLPVLTKERSICVGDHHRLNTGGTTPLWFLPHGTGNGLLLARGSAPGDGRRCIRCCIFIGLGTGGIFLYPGRMDTKTTLEWTRRGGAMRAIVKAVVVGVLGLTVLVGTAAVSVAAPKKKIRWDCICNCSATAKNGKNYQGSQTHFQTEDASGCAIGKRFKCTVDTPSGSLTGSYEYCPTQWKGSAPAGGPGGTGGVLQQDGGTRQR